MRIGLASLISGAVLLSGAVPARSAQAEESIFPVVMTGAEIPELKGRNVAEISLLSCTEGRIRPVLFQIDEFTDDGRIVPNVFKGEAVKDSTPGVIDENDEIVLMARDLGDDCPAEQLARAQGKVTEIAFTGQPVKKVYALAGPAGTLPSTTGLRYDRTTDTIVTPAYTWGYSLKYPHIFDKLSFRDYRGAPPDQLDRLKVRMKARSLGNLMTIRVDEEDIESELRGVRAGPVRIVRDLPLSVAPVPGFRISAVVQFIHYERIWDAQVRFRLPAHAALFLSSLDVQFMMDLNDTRGLRFVTKTEPQGLPVEGNSTQGPVLVDMGSEPWLLMTGQGLTEVVFVNYDKALKLSPSAFYTDNKTLPDPPEETPGCSPCSGFELNRWEDLKAQWYSFGAQVLLPPRFPEGGGSGYYAAWLKRPKVKSATPVN